MKLEPLTDDECNELMFLCRVARAENATKEENERLKGLYRRFEATKNIKKEPPRAAR